MALDSTRYSSIPLGYFNALDGIAQLIEDKLNSETEDLSEVKAFAVAILGILADSLEQEARHRLYGGHLPEHQQYAEASTFVPVLPHASYVE